MTMTNILSFPGLGIGPFELNRVAFSLFGRDVMWYGIIITCGIAAAVIYAMLRSKTEGINSDYIYDFAIFAILFGIPGARLYYIVWDGLENYDSFLDAIAFWNGGLAIYGGIIGGIIGISIVIAYRKLRFGKVFDMIAPGVLLAQAIGRWGNFTNAEAHGGETDLPWRMGIAGRGGTVYVHPTFLYESLWNILGFILINIFYKKKKFDGEVLLWYVAWYGCGRAMIEGLRTDSLMIGSFRVSQLLAAVSAAAAVVLIIILRAVSVRKKKAPVGIEQANGEEAETNQTDGSGESNETNETNEKNGENENVSENH